MGLQHLPLRVSNKTASEFFTYYRHWVRKLTQACTDDFEDEVKGQADR